MNNETNTISTECQTEYEALRHVILCKPQYMAIDEVINEVQKVYKDDNINVEKAMAQHEQFEKVLREHGVDVMTITCDDHYPEQVFTRDIGFTVGDELFVAEMASDIRKGEEKVLEDLLDKNRIPFHTTRNRIEGGDVLVDGKNLFVGMGERTSKQSIMQLQEKLPDYTVMAIPFDEKYLHLDCVFNILSPDTALIFPQAMPEEVAKKLMSMYDCIEVNEEEQFRLGTNVLSIGDNKVVSQPQNKQVNEEMRQRGFKVLEVDFSEIIKSGGSFRCCSLPLVRKTEE